MAVAVLQPRLALAAGEEAPSLGALTLKSLVALAAVLALFAGIVWLLRRLPAGLVTGTKGGLKVEQRLNLDRHVGLAVVALGQERWLVGFTPTSLVCIDRLPSASRDHEADQ